MADFRQQALDYHEFPVPGKTAVCLTKPAETSMDLALAYSPGVAEPVREIAKDPDTAYRYTGKGNTVAVISNGTAILGLGNLGPLASKPVMEGKALLFKHFANIDATDIEIKHDTTEQFINTVEAIADTFGGINLEDIKAPECFEIEKTLIERCNVPVFHDDQHGTAIVTTAGMINALEIQGKKIEDAIIVCMGAGAAAIACMTMLIKCGIQRKHIYMLDRKGVIHSERTDINEYKALFANQTTKRTLRDAIAGADAFLGLSGPDVLSGDDVALMADKPVIFACSNPDPEIKPEVAHDVRQDLIMGTGRSDYPNQVNNVLCFPFIFRGALDVRASKINDEMKIAAVHAIADLAKQSVPAAVLAAYPDVDALSFGPDYVIPKPVDPRLLSHVAKAVAQAAIDSGVSVLKSLPEGYMV
ncbi:malic enzyme-like NAD(P)-binding protein [Shewanella surugensis]|uniref:Malate dehydrogenase n=1 Tax=Shewanella surugensis TaxID=212020 RepID=A0ABT0LE02_9GAMM|nr:malic enzyme-like NAD(P)-binding protein [Shewanella surugensis]MCL1125923.1 malate dehydrogenase [Shewanella surugensis]